MELPGHKHAAGGQKYHGRFVALFLPAAVLPLGFAFTAAFGTSADAVAVGTAVTRTYSRTPLASAPAATASPRTAASNSSWLPPSQVTATGRLASISCPTATHCLAVDEIGNVMSWNGTAWSAPQAVDPSGGGLTSVSCPSPYFCAAVDENSNAVTFDGSTWSQPSAIGSPGTANGGLMFVSCSSASFCMAANIGDYVSTWNGSAWSQASGIDPGGGPLTSVSCTSRTFCMVVDGFGNALVWNGSAWSTPAALDTGGSPLTSVSCTSGTFCIAVDGHGDAFTWGGAAWSHPADIDPGGGTLGLLSVSCSAGGGCAAIDDSGNAITYDGRSWSAPEDIDPNGNGLFGMTSVSCSPEGSCSAVDWDGYAVTRSPPAPTVTSIEPSSGTVAGGTVVDITGSGLPGVSSVYFGGLPATAFAVVSPTEITATAPSALSGTVPVSVDTQWGASPTVLSCADAFAYGVPEGPSSPLGYTSVTPERVADTRPGSGRPYAGRTLGPCATLDVQVAGAGTLPVSGLEEVTVNLTVVSPRAAGYLTSYAAGAVRPLVSDLDFTPGVIVSTMAEVAVSAAGTIAIYNGSNAATDVVIDVEGYTSASGNSTFTPLAPARLCDTRSHNPSRLSGGEAQCDGRTLSPGDPLNIHVAGLGSVPVTATAAVLNLTAVDALSGGYLAEQAAGGTAPSTSVVNFPAGHVVANRVIAALAPDGTIDLISNTQVDAIVDASGYYAPGISGLTYHTVPAQRIADTRCSADPAPSFCSAEALPPANMSLRTIGVDSSIAVTLSGQGGIPLTATAAVLAVTVVGPTASSYLTIYPAGSTAPEVSDLNWVRGETASNLVIVRLGDGGAVNLRNYAGDTDVVVDAVGWFG